MRRTQGTNNTMPSRVRASPSRYTEMGSEHHTITAPRGTARRKKRRRPAPNTWVTPASSPRAWHRAARVDTATVRPTAVTDINMEYTGITS